MILSYILHGHIPYYFGHHYDAVLDGKLSRSPNLLSITPNAWLHFYSSLRYSTQALPVNTLLDTLIRPNADTAIDSQSCVEWRAEPGRAIDHVILTSSKNVGGQWTETAVDASAEIGTLSYSEMLSLPGYSYAQHYDRRHGRPAPAFERPTRTQVADYFAAYPQEVGILDAIHTAITVALVSRTTNGFSLLLKNGDTITCTHLVLATGIFTLNYPPPPLLQPLSNLQNPDPDLPLLVIGSGFTAADVILSQPPTRRILHLFNWDPEIRPSPLKGCHHQAYPEYASVYRLMKLAALGSNVAKTPLRARKIDPFFTQRDWASIYEGLPNAEVWGVNIATTPEGHQIANIEIRMMRTFQTVHRTVSGLAYVTGRRGSLAYLDRPLLREVIGSKQIAAGASGYWISGRTIREKLEEGDGDLEVAPNVFIIGSLTGDSLVRHAYGGCVWAAGKIMGASDSGKKQDPENGKASQWEILHPMRRPVEMDGKVFNQERPKNLDAGMAQADLHLDRVKVSDPVEESSGQHPP